MPKSRLFLGVTLACMAAPALQAPALARPREGTARIDAAAVERDRATSQSLLAALRRRRAEMAQSPDAEHRREAIAFLDRQIDRVTNQALLAALLRRRDELVRTTPDPEHRRDALDFLDRQIESVRRGLGD
jgi:hypothetical protein